MNATEQKTLDASQARAAKTLKYERQLTRCRVSPCGRYLVAGGQEPLLHRWDLETEQRTTLEGHTGWIADLAFETGGKRLFSADYHGTVHCWEYAAAEPKPLWTIREAHAGWIRALAVSPDSNLLATAGNDRFVRLWSTTDGAKVRELSGHAGYIFSVAFHPGGKSLVSGDLFGRILEWEVGTGVQKREFDAKTLHTRGDDFLADVGGVRALAFDREGNRLAAAGMTDAKSNTFCPGTPAAILFDWESGSAQQLRVKEKSDGYINAVRFLADGTLAGQGEGSGGAALWFW